MGTYFNPNNASFRQAVRSQIYVDKTGLLEELNGLLGSEEKCVALSHARRFGKSQAAGMIDAYYSLGSNSEELFSQFVIAKAPDFKTHLNKYNVIHVDVQSFQNDLSVIETKDDALTALVHLGYLGYDAVRKKTFIPNYEVSMAFKAALAKAQLCD